jgi:glycosyltransferase involved in cell wall biosynthesis
VRVAAVIATLGERSRTLEQALARLQGAEVIVASDALDPDPAATAALAESHGARHVRAERPGASAARNAGWRASAADAILFLDDDVLADPGLVAEHAAGHAAEPSEFTGVLGDVRWARGLRVTPFMRVLERGLQFDYGSLADGVDAGWGRFYTANASLKRAALERVGGFDEQRLPFLYEDLDLAKRIHDAGPGLTLRYRRAASAEHDAPMTLEGWSERVAKIAVAERAFVELHPDVPAYFHELFKHAASAPRARGRGARLAALIPPRTPWLGPRVWASAEASCLQALAPRFLAAWDYPAQPPGSPPGGPK